MSPVHSIYTPFQEDDASSGGQTFLFALLNALIVVAIVIVMTVVLVCLFKYRCYRVRHSVLIIRMPTLIFVLSVPVLTTSSFPDFPLY